MVAALPSCYFFLKFPLVLSVLLSLIGWVTMSLSIG